MIPNNSSKLCALGLTATMVAASLLAPTSYASAVVCSDSATQRGTDRFLSSRLEDREPSENEVRIAALKEDAAAHGVTISEETAAKTLAILAFAPQRSIHISHSAHDELVCEWWNGEKRITLYVGDDETWYVQSWGSDMFSEMSDGTINSPSEMVGLWHWLQQP